MADVEGHQSLAQQGSNETTHEGGIMARAFFLVAALVLTGTGSAWATDESNFLGTLKKFGITTDTPTTASKKPCLCNGGILDQRVGTILVDRIGINYIFECQVPNFNAGGDEVGWAGCKVNGGSILVLSK
jgi:hypothetical protein